MKTLIASKEINGEKKHFVLVDECYSNNDESFTLFIYSNYYSFERTERLREFFNTLEEAFDYCQRKYEINVREWQSEVRFTQNFLFEYGVTSLGTPQPYLFGFENGQIIFRLRKDRESFDNKTTLSLDICGNREGLQRLAALLLLCADGESYDKFFHIHLEDEEDFLRSDVEVTLRSPSYFEHLT